MAANILLLDIETSPTLAYVWQAYQTNIIDIETPWQILSYAWKWLGRENIEFASIEKYPERALIQLLWDLFDEADVIVAHNGDQFDIKKCNSMFLRYGLKPPSPYKTVDTRKIAKKVFKFDRNTLSDIAKSLGIGGKMPHTGFEIWLGCMANDPKAWKVMREYNIRDIELLEGVYEALRPWYTSHPNLNLWADSESLCPNCGSDHIHKRGFSYAKVQIRQRLHCVDCGAWWAGKVLRKSSDLLDAKKSVNV